MILEFSPVPDGEASGSVPSRYSDFYLSWIFLYPVSSEVPVLMYLNCRIPDLEVVLVGIRGLGYSETVLEVLE